MQKIISIRLLPSEADDANAHQKFICQIRLAVKSNQVTGFTHTQTFN